MHLDNASRALLENDFLKGNWRLNVRKAIEKE